MSHQSKYAIYPCPNCGKEDAARMSSTAWGHDYMCCSDECGFAFKDSKARCELELRKATQRVADALADQAYWSDAVAAKEAEEGT